MCRAFTLAALLACGLLTGCVQSLHPFYTEEQLVYDPALLGEWIGEDNEKIAVSGDADCKAYSVLYTDKDKKTGTFEVHLAKVNGQLLLDIAPGEPERDDESDFYQIHLLPVHSFFLLERKPDSPDELQVRAMSYDWLKDYLEKNPTAVKHEIIGSDRILMTASTEKVQAFVLEHVNTPDAYDEPATLRRAKPAQTAPADQP